MLRRLLFAVFASSLLAACLHDPPVHPRAKEAEALCVQYIGQGNLTKAEVECDLGLEFSPHFGDLWTDKGLIAFKRGQIDQARDDFEKALRYNQEQSQAYNDLGNIYLQYDHKPGKAHDMFERALKVNPDFTEARYNLALTYFQMHKNEQAKKELRTVIAIAPNLADPYYTLGVIELQEKNRDQSIEHFTRAVQLSPDYAQAWLGLGNAYADAGKYEKAKDAYVSCLRYDKESIECRNNLPIVSRKAALLDPGLQQAKDESATENTPASLYSLALTYREKGLKKEEARSYKKCLGLDDHYAPCHYGLFQIFRDDADAHNASIACKNFLRFASADDFPKEVDTCERFLQNGAN